jgi:hypothetical protein
MIDCSAVQVRYTAKGTEQTKEIAEAVFFGMIALSASNMRLAGPSVPQSS